MARTDGIAEPLPLHAGVVPGSRLARAANWLGIAAAPPRADGPDVSQYQGVINWPMVQSSGMKWVGIRVCHGYIDSQYARNRTGAAWARHRLLYDFMDHGGNATTFLNTIGQLQPGEAAMLDAEATGITEDDCLRWLNQVESYTGRPAVVYTGRYVAGGTIWNSTKIFNGARARILAAYTSEDRARALAAPYWGDAWQWTSTATVPGINGNVDLNQVDNVAAFDRCCGLEKNMAGYSLWKDAGGVVWRIAPDATSRVSTSGAALDTDRFFQGGVIIDASAPNMQPWLNSIPDARKAEVSATAAANGVASLSLEETKTQQAIAQLSTGGVDTGALILALTKALPGPVATEIWRRYGLGA